MPQLAKTLFSIHFQHPNYQEERGHLICKEESAEVTVSVKYECV